MPIKKTHEQYELELLEKELNYIPLEQYQGSATLILHECFNGHIWKVKPSHILGGVECPSCLQAKNAEKYHRNLKINGILYKPIESYIDAQTPILHKCLEGHEWKARPTNILSGTNCPICSRGRQPGLYRESTFKKHRDLAESPGILYVIVLVNKKTDERTCVKIGITKGTSNKDVLRRAGGFKGYDIRIQKLVHGTLEEVYHLEQYLHELWIDYKYRSEWKFGGHQELFEISKLAEILKTIPTKL